MKKAAMLFAVGLSFCGAAFAQSQETMMSPPKVLTVIREVEKPGKAAAHADWETGYPRAYTKANWPTHYIALTATTGARRILFFTGFDSMAAWEKDGNAQEANAALTADIDRLDTKDGEFLAENSRAVLTYMPELSYHPEVPVSGTRYFTVVAIHVKPGHSDHFEEVRKLVKAAHEKANLSDHYAVFRFRLGAPAGSYAIFVPMKSAAELDQFAEVHGQAYKDALGEDGRKKLDEFDREGLESSESQLFQLSPKISYAQKEWVDADPGFWGAKPAAAKPAAPQAGTKKIVKKK
jgi:hypothetical protein